MVYAYFESKEGLWRSCVSRARQRLFDSIDDAVDAAAAPEAQLWLGIQAFFGFVEEQRESWAVLDEGQAGPFIAEVVEVRRQAARHVARLLRDAAVADGAKDAALEQTEPLGAHARRGRRGAGELVARARRNVARLRRPAADELRLARTRGPHARHAMASGQATVGARAQGAHVARTSDQPLFPRVAASSTWARPLRVAS